MTIDFLFDEVVVGGSYESYLYAFYNNLPIISLYHEKFFDFDLVKYNQMYGRYFSKCYRSRKILDFAEEKLLANKSDIYAIIHYFLSLTGKMIFAEGSSIQNKKSHYVISNLDGTKLIFKAKKINFIGTKTKKSRIIEQFIYELPSLIPQNQVLENGDERLYSFKTKSYFLSKNNYDRYSLLTALSIFLNKDFSNKEIKYKKSCRIRCVNNGKNFLNKKEVMRRCSEIYKNNLIEKQALLALFL